MHAGQHTQAMQEVPLEHLAARYSDSEGEEEGAKPEQQSNHAVAQQAAVGAALPPPAGATAAADAATPASSLVEASGSEEGEEDWEDEDWDSEDDDLASALEWADLREGRAGRQNSAARRRVVAAPLPYRLVMRVLLKM
jgi:RIO kinase 1